MTLNIRTLTRCFWVMVEEKEKTAKEVIEKTSAINLLVAFAYATRNYLREEYSYDEEDLHELINHLPKFSTPSSNQPLDTQEGENSPVKEKGGPSSSGNLDVTIRSRKNSTISRRNSSRKSRTFNIKAYERPCPSNIPIGKIDY